MLRIRECSSVGSCAFRCRFLQFRIISCAIGFPEPFDSVRSEGDLDFREQSVFLRGHDTNVPDSGDDGGSMGADEGFGSYRDFYPAVCGSLYRSGNRQKPEALIMIFIPVGDPEKYSHCRRHHFRRDDGYPDSVDAPYYGEDDNCHNLKH